MTHYVNIFGAPAAAAVRCLARWWSSASKEERFALVRASIHGETNAPSFLDLQTAIYLAESEAGEVGQG